MEWLSQNWIWLLVAGGVAWMFMRGGHGAGGMGCCGGHGGHGGHGDTHEGHGVQQKGQGTDALPPSSAKADGTPQPATQAATGQHQHRRHGY